MKNILYLSNTCSENEYIRLYRDVNIYLAQQGCKFNRLFAEGISQNHWNVKMISGRPINQAVLKKKFYKASKETVNGVEYDYLGFINLPYVRQLMIFLKARRAIKKYVRNFKDCAIICDVLNFSLFAAASTIRKKLAFKLIGIVTDIPEILANGNINGSVRKRNKMISECDGLILLAKPMNEKINPNKKPYIVMEGFSDKKMADRENSIADKYDKKVVLYAGLLHKRYGIACLTSAFIDANIENSELHIYGTGDYEEELKEICKQNDRVKFFGTKDNTYVVNEQLKATLLVNPRPTDEEFVKYSFPSKNMEYIVSGTPMLTTDLPSMPVEYKEYCFVADGFDVKSLRDKLIEILSKPREELHNMGAASKAWALKNKSNVVQTQKILKFINNLEI